MFKRISILALSSALLLTACPGSDPPDPTENFYPQVDKAGVYSSDLIMGLAGCTDTEVQNGETIDLGEQGCTPPTPSERYSASVRVNNPAKEALTYDWALRVDSPEGNILLYSDAGSSSPRFPLPDLDVKLGKPVKENCQVTLKVNAPDPKRSKSLTVWSGKCIHHIPQKL